MTKYKIAGSASYTCGDSAGTSRDMSAYIDSITTIGKSVAPLDVTCFGNSAEQIIAGIEQSGEWTIGGPYDDTATTGPDAVFAPLVGTMGTFTAGLGGTASGRRKLSGTALCVSYRMVGSVKEAAKYETVFKLNGTLTVGTY